MRSILEAIAKRPQKMPTMLMGDTNEWRDAAGCLKDLSRLFHIAPTGPSFHCRQPVAALDRIIVDKGWDRGGRGHMPARRRGARRTICPIWARLSAA